MVQLFVTDLDGTLLPAGQTVSAGNIKAAQAAAAAGVTVTLATGRMYRAALPIARQLGINAPLITYNGALIKSVSGEVLYAKYLAPELVREVVDFGREQGWYMQSYSHDEVFFAQYDDYARAYEENQEVKGNVVGWDGLRTQTKEVCKLLSITSGGEETDARVAALSKHFGNRITAMRSNANYAEIVSPGIAKSFALKRLADLLGVPLANTMAIGDADNDIPMLRAAGKSVAMGNAVPAVKALCDYETTDCEADGFAKAIHDYVLGG